MLLRVERWGGRASSKEKSFGAPGLNPQIQEKTSYAMHIYVWTANCVGEVGNSEDFRTAKWTVIGTILF